MPGTLLLHWPIDLAINLHPGLHLHYWQIYNYLPVELIFLKTYIECNLPNGFIQQLSAPVAALVLYAKKHASQLLFSVD